MFNFQPNYTFLLKESLLAFYWDGRRKGILLSWWRETETGGLVFVFCGWSLEDARVTETRVCTLQDGGKVLQLSTVDFSFRMQGWEAPQHVYWAMMTVLDFVFKVSGTVPVIPS